MTLEHELQQRFGFDSFRPGQKALIQAVLDGVDALGILPTGSGKTLCYQLPAALMPGLFVIVSPLLALMDDQVARLQQAGDKRAVALTSRLDPQAFAAVRDHLPAYHFLFAAPETLLRSDVQAALAQQQIACLVIDEAHCISQWGPDFRPAYLQLGSLKQRLHPRCTLALTATAPGRVQQDIITKLQLTRPKQVITNVDRPNIYMGVEETASAAAKTTRALALIQAIQGAAVVYFDSKAQSEAFAQQLQQAGVNAAYYHAGLPQDQRTLRQAQFLAGQLRVMCATSAFGMGVDKADIRLVIYMHVPESLEAYAQGIGRAGRDGSPSASVVLVAPGDMSRAAAFASSLPDAAMITTVFAHPDAYESFDDPQVALVLAYVHAGFAQKRVQAELARRLAEKQIAANAVRDFLAAACHRQYFLTYFDAPINPHDDHCCGPITQPVLESLAPSVVTNREAQSWQQVFAQIFNEV